MLQACLLQRNEENINRALGGEAQERMSALKEGILGNAVIAKYCRRDAELQAAIALAKAHLDKDVLERFVKILAEVVPGELPKER